MPLPHGSLPTTLLLATLSLLPLLPLQCLADELPFYRNALYNDGDYGVYPTADFKTQPDIHPPRMNFMDPFTACDDGSYIFVAPRGNVADSKFYILDAEGSLIWGPDHRYGEVYNFQVQEYKGEPYLTFWAGDDSVGGHGEGKYYMLDKHYEEHTQISAGEGIRGDLHGFSITSDDTAVYTGYEIVPKDLSALGKSSKSHIWESLFQELDITTGEVLFQWRASDHFPYDLSYVDPNEATKKDPWDFFHINSVEKDADANYLVSTRYGRCALYISGRTGEILWQLGGKNNSFTDLSDGAATTFLGQHDVHWHDTHHYITLFDNRADWFNSIAPASQGTIVAVDLEAMTAEHVASYPHPHNILSVSQGSHQMLPSGNVLVGWGINGAVTEFSPEGDVVCDAFFMAESAFGSGDVQSYRNLKFNWTGAPKDPPDVVLEDGALFISWLGATEVREWLLQDCDEAEGGLFEVVAVLGKEGFETGYVVAEGERVRQYVRVIAVDAGGSQLATSAVIDLGDVDALFAETEAASDEPEGHDDEMDMEHDHDDGTEMGDGHDSAPPHKGAFIWESKVRDVHILPLAGVLAVLSNVVIAWVVLRRYRGSGRALRSDGEEGVKRFAHADAFEGRAGGWWGRVARWVSRLRGLSGRGSWRDSAGFSDGGFRDGEGLLGPGDAAESAETSVYGSSVELGGAERTGARERGEGPEEVI